MNRTISIKMCVYSHEFMPFRKVEVNGSALSCPVSIFASTSHLSYCPPVFSLLDKIASCSLSWFEKATMMMTITASLSCHFKRNKEPSDTPCLLNVLSWRPVVLSRLGVHFIAFPSFHSAGNVSFFSSKRDKSQWLLTLRISGNQGHHVILSPDNVSLERRTCRPRRRGRVCLFLGTCVQMLPITKMRRRLRFLDDGIVFTRVVVTRPFLDSRKGIFFPRADNVYATLVLKNEVKNDQRK